MPHLHDPTGQRFDRLVIVGRAPNQGKKTRWHARCDCGAQVVVSADHLRRGLTRSCGCLQRERASQANRRWADPAMEKMITAYFTRCRRTGLEISLSRADFPPLLVQPCHYCGCPPYSLARERSSSFAYNSLDRVDSSRGYHLDNVVPCCNRCNTAKLDMTVTEFRAWVGAVYARFNQPMSK